jgi:phosphatidate cytidylyltransferase
MKRVLTALLLIPFIAWVVLFAPTYVFLAVLAAVALLCYYEYCGIVSAYGIERPSPAGYGAGVLILVMPQVDATMITLFTLLALVLILRLGDLARALPYAAALVLGLTYVFGAWRTASGLRAISPYWLLFGLTINWVGDSAAFYVGRTIGRHKLAPRISPGKSWEGSAASVAATMVYAYFFLTWLLPSFPIELGLAIAAAANIAGQMGDLAESALKRGAGVKDSGTMLPGHGGWLDRVDSSLFAVPVVYFLVSLKGS